MEIKHKNTLEIICPWCGNEIKDSWDIYGECGSVECAKCEKLFEFESEQVVYYTTYKATKSCVRCGKIIHEYKNEALCLCEHCDSILKIQLMRC